MVVDHLTEHGVMEPARLYESPFTDLTPRGPDGLFEPTEIDELLRVLQAVRATAIAA
jgi:type I restriction enzyme, R subunit